MSGIGISPCPPFAKPPGVPGVLYDGNTAAWFKHNDMNTVIKDGADRVSFWLDRYNYAIGAELVNQATWYTGAAYWTGTYDVNWSTVGTTLSSNGNNGTASKPNFFTIGATYKIVISITRVGGTLRVWDAAAIAASLVASGTYTIYFTATAVDFALQSLVFNGTVTALSVKRVTGNHLLQATGASQPLWSAANGILFDGVADFMKCIAFAYIQPEMIYFVGRQATWSNGDTIYDGNLNDTAELFQATLTPQIYAYAGILSLLNNNLILNTFGIIRNLFNGVNSILQINLSAAIVGNFGASNSGGFTLGSIANGGAGYSNIEVKEIILRRSADNAATQLQIYNYLKNVNGL